MEKYIYKAKLERVIDGDTIDALIDVGFDIWVKKRIRYKGIDTWESRTRDLDEKKKGLAAKDRNKELLEKISSKPGFFRLKSYGVGKYGRVLGEIFILDNKDNPININETLIKEGHAYVYEGGKKKLFFLFSGNLLKFLELFLLIIFLKTKPFPKSFSLSALFHE